jgi:hypothetical protein
MKKLILSVVFFCVALILCQLHAQSIANKSWKTYIDAPINDTVILNMYIDSSSITNTKGQVMVRHHCKISGDTLTIEDTGTEEQGCTGIKGSYKINYIDNGFTLTLISDECDGRSQALADRKWIEAIKK